MKLEIKHLASYLPYELKMYQEDLDGTEIMPWELKPDGVDFAIEYQNKPILRPLSDLTKEIEVDGLKFVPLEVLGQTFIKDGFIEDGLFGWGQPTGGDDEQDYYLLIEHDDTETLHFYIWVGEPREEFSYCTEQIELPYYYYNRLIEWHFDVFGLIDAGLAIDINTLEK